MNCQIFLFFVIVTSTLSADLRRTPSDTLNDDNKTIKTKSPYEHGNLIKRNTENYLRVVSVSDVIPEIITADTLDPVYKGGELLYRTADPTLAKHKVHIIPADLESQPRSFLYPADSSPQTYQVYDPQFSPSISDAPSLAPYYQHDQRLAKNKIQNIPAGESKVKTFYKANSVSERYQVGVYDPQPITLSEIPSIARSYLTPLNSYYVRKID